jgi:Mn2+/Fe2+ NRAMP family transporter
VGRRVGPETHQGVGVLWRHYSGNHHRATVQLYRDYPIKALVYSAVINGVVAVPLIFIIALIARSKNIMGRYKSGWLSNLLLWLTFLGMGAAAVGMFATFVHP